MKKIGVCSAGLLVLLLIVGCQSAEEPTATEPTATAEEERPPVEAPAEEPPVEEPPVEEPPPDETSAEEPLAGEEPPAAEEQPARTPAIAPATEVPLADAPAELPAFPWPPPRASTMMNINDAALRIAGDSTTLGQVSDRLVQALDVAGYVEKSYFAVPDGFALVTRLEQIDPDGTPLDPPDRWSEEAGPVRQFDLRSILRALFTANPGYFRILVFVATPHPFSQSDQEVRREEAVAWLREGVNRLPDAVARQPYAPAFRTTALVYEFEQPESGDPQLVSGRLTARTHLQRSGLLSAIESDAEE